MSQGISHLSITTSKTWNVMIEATYKDIQNDTMRNDIRRAKIAFDETTYILCEAVDNLTPYTDPAWMRLIDTMPATEDSKDWKNRVCGNRQNPTDSIAYLERSKGDGIGRLWEVRYSVMDNVLQIEIPKGSRT